MSCICCMSCVLRTDSSSRSNRCGDMDYISKHNIWATCLATGTVNRNKKLKQNAAEEYSTLQKLCLTVRNKDCSRFTRAIARKSMRSDFDQAKIAQPVCSVEISVGDLLEAAGRLGPGKQSFRPLPSAREHRSQGGSDNGHVSEATSIPSSAGRGPGEPPDGWAEGRQHRNSGLLGP